MGKRVAFVTLGCAKNEVDTAHMKEDLLQAGYTVVGSDDAADVVIVNTCSFIQDAVEESIDVILEIAREQAVIDGDTKLVVAGCLPSRYGNALGEELTEADRFVPCAQEDNIVGVLNELFDHEVESIVNGRVVVADGPSAYVKISDGCNRYCSYCTIPFIRGPYHSFSFDQIEGEVGGLIDAGVREIVLIAQDSGLWGLDLVDDGTSPTNLPLLLKRLARLHPDTWFRVMYLQPGGIDDQLLSVMEDHDNICSYLDIPLQHANAQILHSMNRSGDKAYFLERLHRIRQRLTGVALRTTVIVGYPGETEEQFEELCDFIAEAEFDYVGVFPYSPEEGTRAANMPNQVDEDTKMERFQRLRDLADQISASRIKRHVGESMEVLVLGEEEDGQLYGRCQYQAPEVDGVVYVDAGEVGDFVNVTITDTLLYEMEGEVE
ncbi:MAG: 30S ribosomal protein S12 methylthiotransferase RimO [Coriobacteriia bacterium]|nr:30S ribosomal protein S12 methylthiotransferase RimO [Coriobacteriia bacterium]